MYQCISTGPKQCVLSKKLLAHFDMVSGRQDTKVEGYCFFSIQKGQLPWCVFHGGN